MSGSFTLRPRPPLDGAAGLFPVNIETDPSGIAEIALGPIFIGTKGDPGASLAFREATLIALTDGEQILTLATPATSAGTLFINGLAQSGRAYARDASSVSIPASLNVLTGDVLTYVYPTLGNA